MPNREQTLQSSACLAMTRVDSDLTPLREFTDLHCWFTSTELDQFFGWPDLAAPGHDLSTVACMMVLLIPLSGLWPGSRKSLSGVIVHFHGTSVEESQAAPKELQGGAKWPVISRRWRTKAEFVIGRGVMPGPACAIVHLAHD